MRATKLVTALAKQHLAVLGTCPPDANFCAPEHQCIALIGPQPGAEFWSHFTQIAEFCDQKADPMDRWSKRVLNRIGDDFGGVALFPSDGPPWPPFFGWAQQSGEMWQSPVGMLVHHQSGLWVAFRGALLLPFPLERAAPSSPCLTCAERPCETACPVSALGPSRYDTDACHVYLDQPGGADCMDHGCAARRACPASQSHARLSQHSAYHMRQFHR